MVKERSTWAAAVLTMAAVFADWAAAGAAAPAIFWASDPVRPNETVLVQGSDFGPTPTVEIAQEGLTVRGTDTVVFIDKWLQVPVLQGSDCSLKFVVPADWEMGVFAFRVDVGGTRSPLVRLNAPDPWWVQGDAGETATPGGWLRVLGKSLNFGGRSRVRLQPEQGNAVALESAAADGYSLRFDLPADLEPGLYEVNVSNGPKGEAGWRKAGTVRIAPPPAWPTTVFSVLDFYGKDAEKEARKTLIKYGQVPDRTEGIQAALEKARKNGGGIVYFPAGRYGIRGELSVPPRTVLRGEGTGLVVLWWGVGRFNLDGGSDMGYARNANEPRPPANLIFGRDFAIEDLSLYVPPDYETVVAAQENVRIRRVRVRIDHYWTLHTQRYEGVVVRMGRNCEVSDCDILAKGTGVIPGDYCLVVRNQIRAGKTHCPLGGARQAIVEDNAFVSMHPTAYMHIAGQGRNLYYARNRQEALHVHQADYSFTFDAGPNAYFGKVASLDGTQVTLAADPTYPKWAQENSSLWKRSVIVIQDGRGAGQYRNVVANKGRSWEIDRPFDCPPDASSLITIVPFNGRVLVVGNRFEDANWVNAGFGTSIDVVYAENKLYRCAQLLNYGMASRDGCQPAWYIQYLDNELNEGYSSVDTTGSVRNRDSGIPYAGPITRCVVHRRHILAKDNSGSIGIGGSVRDVVVEGCILRHPMSTIKADGDAEGLVFRNNVFEGSPAPRYEGRRLGEAVVIPPGK